MHSTRYAIRPAASHCGGRAARHAFSPYASRGLAHWSPFGPHFARFSGHSDFSPFFRLLDDSAFRGFDNFFPAVFNPANTQLRSAPQSFQPRFDIREVENAYELKGEIPGAQSEDLSIEFTDPQTLIIKGQTSRESNSSNPATTAAVTDSATANVSAKEVADDASDTASVLSSSSYQKPSVEDAEPEQAESSAAGAATLTSSALVAETPAQTATTPTQQQDSGRYWMSERSYGEFQRTFAFPAPVDQDSVRASLRDGILSISVPKAAKPTARRINIE